MPSSLPDATVTTEAELNADLAVLPRLTAGSYTITVAAGITLTSDLDAINLATGASLTIDGGGNVLSGGDAFRGLLLYIGSLTLNDVGLENFASSGGAGGASSGAGAGGGGAGLGGGLFVSSDATAVLAGVSLLGNTASGGQGGDANFTAASFGGGGGGGMGGAAGPNHGGGGVGMTAHDTGPGIVVGAKPGGYSFAPYSPAYGLYSPGGVYGGGGNGGGGAIYARLGGGTYAGAGGGVNGGTPIRDVGGSGGFGGGGGGGSFNGASAAAAGGAGGFGGGGGGGGTNGGLGGFGGGGGGGAVAGAGGFGGGAGGTATDTNGGGGGGLGAGGDIFVQQGGVLVLDAGVLQGGLASPGAGSSGTGGSTGLGLGNGIFIQGNNTITLDPAANTTLSERDDITDQSGSIPGTSQPGAGALLIMGGGTVSFEQGGTNTYTGGTTIDGGTLLIDSAAELATGALVFQAGGVLIAENTPTLATAITLNSGGGVLVNHDQITLSGLIKGAGGLSLGVGSNQVTLTAANGFSGGTTLDGGQLYVGRDSALGAPNGELDFAGGQLVLTGNFASSRALVISANSRLMLQGQSLSVDGAITGAGTLSVGGTGGTLFLSGVNPGTDVLHLSSGELQLHHPGAVGSGGVALSGSATLVIDGSTMPTQPISGFAPGEVIDLSGLRFVAGATARVSGGTLTTVSGGQTLALDTPGLATGAILVASADGGGTRIMVASSFTITDEADLNAALSEIDIGGSKSTADTAYVFTFASTGTVALTTDLLAIDLPGGSSLSIDGAGQTLDGGGAERGFLLYAGSLDLENLTIANARAQGGTGGIGFRAGGGGAGLGGGLFVASGATATLAAVNFTANTAHGGAGGATNTGANGGGGGGGMGGAGGNASSGFAGGGGGGVGLDASGGAGSTGSTSLHAGGAGILQGAPSGAAGEGFLTTPGASGGVNGGGGGGGLGSTSSSTGAAGGGGTAGSAYTVTGAFGGGGGGGGSLDGTGGVGGFGGGGGSDAIGGFGGGGGGLASGGFGGGAGSAIFDQAAGGGGLGAGGGIFVEQGGVLVLGSGAFGGDGVAGGAAGLGSSEAASQGSAFGSGIFAQGTNTLTLDPAAATTLDLTDIIADEHGSVPADTNAAGLAIVGAGTVRLAAVNTFSGGVTLAAGSTLDLGNSGGAGVGAITFGGSDATLELEAGIAPANTVDTLQFGDAFDIAGFGGGGAQYKPSTKQLVIGKGGNFVLLALDKSTYQAAHFATAPDAAGTGLLVTYTACYASGTHIATPRGECAIERLRIGDRIRTAGGEARAIKWIGRRTYAAAAVANNPHLRPVRILASALAPGVPARDLLVSPLHGIFLDGALIPAGALVNGKNIHRQPAGAVTYFHVELDSHDLLLAEGAPAESFVDIESRKMFDNAAEFVRRYPHAPQPPSRLPRIEHGPALQRIQDRLAPMTPSRGELRGHVERVCNNVLEGWVMDAADPCARVELEITGSGVSPMLATAGQYRIDLDRAGFADGIGGFRVDLPHGAHQIHVRRVTDRAPIPVAT